MRTISAPTELSGLLENHKLNQSSVGLVPTMGALHQGHLALISRSRRENDVTVVSIFVNPIQFNNAEDLANYPRTLDEDLALLREEKVDYVFIPEVSDLYPQKPSITLDFGNMAEMLEGEFRPGHFNGVGIVVSKLLHVVNPHKAYFGLKDLQQFLLIRKMCEDLSFQSEIIGVDTVREPSGLAMSSRNQRLSDEGKSTAGAIFKGLKMIEEGIAEQKELTTLMDETQKLYRTISGLEVEYLAAVNPQDMSSVTSYAHLKELAVCFAGYVEGIRLIDNLYLRLK